MTPLESALRHFQDGLRLQQDGRLDAAAAAYGEALALLPAFADALVNLGNIFLAQRNFPRAEEAYARAIQAEPAHVLAHFNRGRLCSLQQRHDEAFHHYRQAVSLRPDFSEAYNCLVNSLWDQGQTGRAVEFCRQVLVRQPEDGTTNLILGGFLRQRKQYDQAEALCRKALALAPRQAHAYNELAAVLIEQGRSGEAIALLRRALETLGEVPQFFNNLGAALLQQGDTAAALVSLQRALVLNPAYSDAINNLGIALRSANRFDEALALFRQGVQQNPADPRRQVNYALGLFQDGRFREGAPYYEKRWDLADADPRPALAGRPEWQGQSLAGKTLLLYGEQGFGDTLMCCRYVPELAARGAKVVLVVPPPLVRLLGTLPGAAQVVADDVPLPPFDCHLAMMSLPGRMGTEVASIPAPIPYLSPVTPADRELWRQRLQHLPGLKVGLAWAGNPRSHDLSAFFVDARRSIGLEQLASLADVGGVSFVSLQKDTPLPAITVPSLFDAMSQVTDFADTAALVANLDLVISVDTSVVHLAGAIGKPVWILSRLDGCWRWLRDRDDTPWYPLARLFRQQRAGEWEPPIQRLREALAALVAARNGPIAVATLTAEETLSRQADRQFLAAQAEQQAGRPREALAGYQRAMALKADFPEALNNSGLCHLALGQWAEAVAAFRQAISARPDFANAHNNLGNALERQGDLAAAVEAFRQAIWLVPEHFDAQYNLGNTLLAYQQPEEALVQYRQALILRPDSWEACCGVVVALRRLGLSAQAEVFCRRMMAEAPENFAPMLTLADLLRQRGALDEAETLCRRALALAPARPQPHGMLGALLIEQRRFSLAASILRAGLAIAPDDPALCNNLGVALLECSDVDGAFAANDRALALRPDYAEARLNRANLLRAVGRFAEAAALLRALIADKPRDPVALGNLGNVLRDLRRIDDSLAAHRRSLELRPDDAQEQVNYALALLQAGRYREGWLRYEARWKIASHGPRPDLGDKPEWAGEDLAGKTILLYGEQGYGDVLQFCRFAPLVAARGGRVVVAAPPPLLRLLGSLAGVAAVVNSNAVPPAFDTHLPLMSLPRVLDVDEPADIPARIPYLAADPADLEQWRQRLKDLPVMSLPQAPGAAEPADIPADISFLAADLADLEQWRQRLKDLPVISLPRAPGAGEPDNNNPVDVPDLADLEQWRRRLKDFPGLKVGLVWAGGDRRHISGTHLLDQRRSLRLEQFAPLAGLPITLVSLQKGPAARQTPPSGLTLFDAMDLVEDFADTAALMANLDLIVSVDTVTAHLAGALGKPVWILSRFDGCWRWLQNRDDSPWYPTARLFRQERPGDWAGVIQRLRDALVEQGSALHPPGAEGLLDLHHM